MVNQVVKILNRYNETSCSEETQPKSLTNTTIEPSCEEDN